MRRLRMAEKNLGPYQLRQFFMFLERNIVVHGQAFVWNAAQHFCNQVINRPGGSVFQISQKWMSGFSLHQHQKRSFVVFVRLYEISFEMAEYSSFFDLFWPFINHGSAVY